MGKFNEWLNKKITPIPALYKNPYTGVLKDLFSKQNKGKTVAKKYVETQLDEDYLDRIKKGIYKYPAYAEALEVPMLQDLKNIYLKTPQTFNSFSISKYRPKNGTQANYFNSKILDTIGAGIVVKAGDNLKNKNVIPTDKLEDINYGEISHITPNNNAVAVLPGIGHATVGIGHDQKGEYVSYYDEWDVGNFKPNTKHLIDYFNKSVPVYGRVYLDDYYDIPEEARGNPFITPAVVTAEAKKSGGIIKAQNSAKLISKINQSDANFVKRLLDPNRKSIPDWETKGAKIATHKLGWAEDDHGAYVYPEVQEIDGQLIDFSRPPYAPDIADYMAHKNNNIIRMSPEEADWFTRNYKQYYPSFKKGGRIHIKKKNRGSFTRWCKGKVTEECIRRGKNSPNPTIRKKATFAANARRWKHENGGILKAQEGTGNGFWSKLWNAVKAGGMAARDAKLGAVGAQQVRDLYSEGKNQEAQDLAKQYAKANTTGIALAGGAASTGLLGDLMVTGATTAADTFIDEDTENFGKNLLTNVSADLLGNGVGKIVNFKNFLKNNSDLQKWLFGKGSLKNKFSDGKFIYNEFVNPDWRKYELSNKMILSKINRDWGLQYLEPEDYLKKVGNSKGNTNPNTKTVYIKKAKFPWANQHTVGHEINHVIQQGYIPSSWNNIILNNQSFGRVPKKSIYPTVRYGEYTTVDPNYADTFPSLNDIRLRSENAPDPKQILWYSSPDEIDSEFAGGLFEGYNPKESIENIQQKWNLAGFSIDDYEIENIDKLFRGIDVNNKQRILLNGKRKNPILNSTKSYLHAVNESSDDIDNIVKNINSGIKIGTGASIGTSVELYNLLNDNE